MQYKYIFICIFAIFLSLNVISAADVSDFNETNVVNDVDSDVVSTVEGSIKESSLNHGNTDVLNENNMNNVHISPDGVGDGSSEENPISLNNAISNLQDNSALHLADGNYTFNSVLSISVKNNITISANNPGNVIISGGSNSLASLFSLEAVNNFKLKGIIFKDITFKTNLIKSASKSVNRVTCDSQDLFFEDCSFINCTTPTAKNALLFSITSCGNFSMKNCYFLNNNLANTVAILQLTIHPVLNRSSTPNTYFKKSYCNIQNCTFENNTCQNYIVNFPKGNIPVVVNSEISVSECNFINNSFSTADIHIVNTQFSAGNVKLGKVVYSNPEITSIVGCNFSSNVNLPAILVDSLSSEGLIFEDNFVKSKYGIKFSDSSLKAKGTFVSQDYTTSMNGFYLGKLHSIVSITILDAGVVNVTAGDKITISTILVDNMDNSISIPNLRLVINGSENPATFNNGVYETEYIVPNTSGLLDIDVNYTTVESVSGYSYIDKQHYDNFTFSLLDNRMCEVTGSGLFVKPALNMSMDNVSNSSYGEDISISVNISNLESGSLVYEFIKGNEVVKTLPISFTNNVSTITVNDLPAGDYKVTAKYLEDDNFGTSTVSKQFTVNKANSTVQIIIDSTIPVGDNITVQAVLPANATGNVTYRLKGENKTVNVTGSAVFAGLSEGNYTIYAVYNGDDNYNPSEEYNATFRVVKVDPKLVIEYSVPVINENVTVTVIMDQDITGDVNVTVNKLDPVVRQVVNGTLTFNIANVPYGPQNITVSFRGNDKYNEMENNTSFFVNKLDVNLAIAADTVTYGEPLVVNVTANEKFSGDVIVKIGNLTEIAHVVDGKGNATFNNLAANSYIVTASCAEDETFNADTKNITATVKGVEVPADKALNTNVPANSKSPTFSIKLDKDATGNFTVSVDNGKIVKTVSLKDGSASITVDNLAVGSHQVTVSYSGDGKYAPITQNTTVTIKEPAKPKVTKKATKIVAKKKTFKAKKKVKKYTITLKSGKTLVKKVKVTLKVKGKTYKATTNNKGKATFKIKNLKKKGKYTATIKFAGNKNYKPTTKKVKLTVKK
ncbi:Ig-like domain-containing protein [Methanobrevibacter thaueri]|uniref:Bacterial Ig-like domain-containing protein n=1 Tax=Methanobrevibacter thaueri TaxID=190975 RepID=A0A315XMI3_9EURY|nr:Ig-like domain-containing protein [Methanobrevibacter thaueri]PWB87546.1 hypothetical protein MBBTH_08140 [Methanobrevibacter thaueri]